MTPNVNKSLADIFDVELTTTDKSVEELKISAKNADIDSLEKQRDYVKSNIVALIEKGMSALDNMTTIANSTESGKDFKVVSDMITALVDTNMTLLDCEVAHKAAPMLDSSGKTDATQAITNNTAVFVGSTSELSKYLKESSIDVVTVEK